MKRFLTTLGIALLCLTSFAQRFDEDWADFGRYAKANASLTKSPLVVFMGDSITDFWVTQRPSFFTDNDFVGRGISGQTTSKMLVRFRNDVIALHPRIVVILAGTNDIAHNLGAITYENSVGNILSMCELARVHGILPIVCSVTPSHRFFWRPEIENPAPEIIAFNKVLKAAADTAGIIYVDYHSALAGPGGSFPEEYSKDGCHPVAAGYAKMEEVILPYIRMALN